MDPKNDSAVRLYVSAAEHTYQDLVNKFPSMENLSAARIAADIIDWWGMEGLVNAAPNTLHEQHLLPEIGEEAHHWLKRVWPKLKPEDRGTALAYGLQKAVTIQNITGVGFQLRIWKAYKSGEWQSGPYEAHNIRDWIRQVLSKDEEISSPEISRLSAVVEAVAWLEVNHRELLPDKVEKCFIPPLYGRFGRVAPKILARVAEVDLVDDVQVDLEIIELAKAAQDQEKDQKDLDQMGRQKSRIPPIVAIEHPGRDLDTGQYRVTIQLTEAQKILLQQKGKGWIIYRLEGERYDTEEWIKAQYVALHDTGIEDRFYVHYLTEKGWTKYELAGDGITRVEDLPGIQDRCVFDGFKLTVYDYWVKVEEEKEDANDSDG